MKHDDARAGAGKSFRFLVTAHPIIVIVALGGAILLGLRAKPFAHELATAGSIYLLLLEMTVLPIIISAVASGVARLVQEPRLFRVFVRAFASFVLFAVLVAAAAGAAGIIGSAGTQVSEKSLARLSQTVTESPKSAGLSVPLSAPAKLRSPRTLLDLLTRVVPRNIFATLTLGAVVPTVLFSFLFGLAMGLLREKQQEYLIRLTEGVLRAFTLINTWLIYLLPLGIICLIAPAVATAHGSVLRPMLGFVKLFLAAAAACVVINIVVIWIRSRKSLGRVLWAVAEPTTCAFITSNSVIAVPYALRALADGLQFRRKSVNFVQPAITAVGSFGNLFFFVLAALFVARLYGRALSPADYAALFLGSTIAAAGTSGKSGAASVALLPLVFAPLGLPIEAAIAAFGAMSVIFGPVLALVDVSTSMAATGLAVRRDREAGEPHKKPAGKRGVRIGQAV